jgi:predicted dehydrogenase
VARLTLGVIGAGTWAIAAHLPAFAARDDVEPLIVCRRDADLLAAVRTRFGFPRATTDWREVIEARPDLLVLAGPVALRAEQARAALDAGCHILAEKPFTVSAADAWDLERRARDAGRVLMLCYAWNEMGIVEAARRLLTDEGGVGRVEHVSLVMSTVVRDLLTTGRTYVDVPIDSPPRIETWSDPGVSGGGYGQGQLTHGLGLLFRLLPERATEVVALTGPASGSVELHDAIALRFGDGAIGTVSGAALPWGSFGNTHQVQLRVTGERGQVLLDLDRPLVRRTRGEEDDVTVELSEDDITWSFARVVDRFVELASGRTTENRSPGELGARAVEVLEAMYRSAASGRWEPTSLVAVP